MRNYQRISVQIGLISLFWLTFLLSPQKILATSFVVSNEYTTGINATAVIPDNSDAIAIPFKVPTNGNYRDFEYMIQRSTYIGNFYGFSAITSTPYFDNNSQYPTPKFFEKIKLAVLPSNYQATENPPTTPDYALWGYNGDTSHTLVVGSNPQLLEPEIIRDSTRYKWLKFNLENGVNLDNSKWYWLVMYPNTPDPTPEEWKYVVMRVVADYPKAVGSTNNFGVSKEWQFALLPGFWNYNPGGDYVGFRIAAPTPIVPSKTPVIIIPGIGGSEFRAKADINSNILPCGASSNPLFYPKDGLVWVNALEAASTGCDDYFDVLKLKADGNTPDYPDVVLNGTIFTDTYGKLIQFLQDNGYELNKTLFVFPYDWRKDIALTSSPLNNLINSIKIQTGSQKVDIVAHSMGGLVARNYIKDSGNASNVRKLITLGTPYLGSPLIIKFLMYGDYFGEHFGPIGLAPSEGKDMVQNLIGAYELFPDEKYFTFYNGSDENHLKPFSDQRDMDTNNIVGDLDYYQTKQLLTNLGYNTSLFNQAETFHSLDDNLNQTNGVEVTNIVGSGLPTLGQIQEKYIFNFAGIKISKRDELKRNGDGTVPLLSAALKDNTTSINLIPQTNVIYAKYNHGMLVGADPVLEFIKNNLNGDNHTPTGLQSEPFSLNGQSVSAHSPVNIHAYDSVGNHTGPTPNGEFEADIPGSSYDTLEDSKYIWLPEGGDYTIKLEATDQGSFDLKVRDYQDDHNIKTTTYQEIPITNASKGELALIEDSPIPPQLLLDRDGDNTVDQVINPSSTLTEEEAQDQNPPVTTIGLSGTQGTNGWYQSDVIVTLNATDDNSGVLKTEYSPDGGVTVQTYTTPFVISTEGFNNLIVKSTDKTGNQEQPQTISIKIDKTIPKVSISANPSVLWSPNGKFVKVLVNGDASDDVSGVSEKKFQVLDDYHFVEPDMTGFGQTISLQSYRVDEDKDGRVYTIKVKVTDLAGNSADAKTTVLVPHSQPKN